MAGETNWPSLQPCDEIILRQVGTAFSLGINIWWVGSSSRGGHKGGARFHVQGEFMRLLTLGWTNCVCIPCSVYNEIPRFDDCEEHVLKVRTGSNTCNIDEQWLGSVKMWIYFLHSREGVNTSPFKRRFWRELYPYSWTMKELGIKQVVQTNCWINSYCGKEGILAWVRKKSNGMSLRNYVSKDLLFHEPHLKTNQTTASLNIKSSLSSHDLNWYKGCSLSCLSVLLLTRMTIFLWWSPSSKTVVLNNSIVKYLRNCTASNGLLGQHIDDLHTSWRWYHCRSWVPLLRAMCG